MSVSAMDVPLLMRAFLVIVVLGWGLDALYRHWALAGPRAVRSLVWDQGGRWRLLDGGGCWCPAQLTDAYCLGPGFSLLRWRDSRGLHRVAMVCADSSTEIQRRRLARYIRWRGAAG